MSLVSQMVYALVEPAGNIFALPGDRRDSARWRQVFVESGGMRHLLGLLGGDRGIDPAQVLPKNAPWHTVTRTLDCVIFSRT